MFVGSCAHLSARTSFWAGTPRTSSTQSGTTALGTAFDSREPGSAITSMDHASTEMLLSRQCGRIQAHVSHAHQRRRFGSRPAGFLRRTTSCFCPHLSLRGLVAPLLVAGPRRPWPSHGHRPGLEHVWRPGNHHAWLIIFAGPLERDESTDLSGIRHAHGTGPFPSRLHASHHGCARSACSTRRSPP